MKRREFLSRTGLSAALVASFSMESLFAAEKKKILYFDESMGYVHPPTKDEADGSSYGAKLVKKLCAKLGYEAVCTKDGAIFDGDLSQYAAFIFYTTGDLDKPRMGKKALSAQGVKNFYAAIRGGVGFVGIHSATDTWRGNSGKFVNDKPEDYTQYCKMIGAEFTIHGSQQETTLTLTDPVELPSLKALGSDQVKHFDEWYCMKNFSKDLHVILVQETKDMRTDGNNICYNRPKYPSTWARMEGKGRVAYTSLGHGNEMFDKPLFQGVLTDLISFAAGDLDIDLTPNIGKVTPGANVLQNR